MASNRAQILISAVDQTKTAFDSIKRGLGGIRSLFLTLGPELNIAHPCGTLRFAADLTETPAPSDQELEVLRGLHARTRQAHGVAA